MQNTGTGNLSIKQRTPLHWAAHRNHPHVARALIKAGADVHAKNGKGQTPRDLAGEDVARLFGPADDDPSPAAPAAIEPLPILPNYLQNPQFFYGMLRRILCNNR